ncbi:protein FAM221A isoform X3 [Carcharodon carcharias]|uniref:protein FAM221A isoform X3 n=1 Tax=Carcharodon carcharias TaxID=13397 RepID=UPI001B7E2571|nr:protein FAM221A isoform X3 [Carcharodon carcharias]
MSKHTPDFLAQWTVADLGLFGTGVCLDRDLSQPGIVGEDDGGTLFTPEEYERYKKEVLSTRLRNRLFVSWTSPNGIDCKLIGPETQCFCQHRYKQHKTDYKEIPIERPILLPCRVTGCRCISFNYVPLNGTQPIRCRCKHFADDHNEMAPYKCKNCAGCAGFHSSFTCGCSHPTYAHTMIVETKEERLARGRSVGPDVPYAAMGGLTGFNALTEGYMRLDSSGIDVYGLSRFAHLPTAEERDMAYFESRYQERLKMEKAAAKGQKKIPASKGETSQVPKPSRGPK